MDSLIYIAPCQHSQRCPLMLPTHPGKEFLVNALTLLRFQGTRELEHCTLPYTTYCSKVNQAGGERWS